MAIDDIRKTRIDKLKKLRNAGVNPYPADSHRTHTVQQALDGFDDFVSNNDHIILSGRMMARREHGGSVFIDLRDGTGSMQAYLKKDILGDKFDFFQDTIDIGDFIEVKGTLFKTKKDEKTVQVSEYRILTKTLLPLPEKWHGLQDVEERYRKRYLDLLMNPEIAQKFKMRAQVYRTIRRILEKHEFLEVVTPTLQPLYGGASARPFKTHINAYDMNLFLRIAPELYLKRLLAGGYERVFEFTTNFRNEGVDREHNPEFSVVEWYAAYKGYEWNMVLCEELFQELAQDVNGSTTVKHENNVIDFKGPYKRMSFKDAMSEYAHIDITEDFETLKGLAREKSITDDVIATKDILVDELFKQEVRTKLIDPTFIHDYPKSMFPLAKAKPDNSDVAEVFQFYAGGFEMVKAFTELNDPIDQRERFAGQEDNRAKGDEEAQRLDEDFIESMEYGMPPNSGVGIGLDRLTALLTNSHSIREVILFPFMRPIRDKE